MQNKTKISSISIWFYKKYNVPIIIDIFNSVFEVLNMIYKLYSSPEKSNIQYV